ncbi:MAG: hypothetical protein RL385_642, partial [Pseudomonadota bacterium]
MLREMPPKPSADATTDEQLVVRRQAAAELLGISTTSLRRLEGDLLHPHVDPNGIHWFAVADLEAARARVPVRARPRAPLSADEQREARAGRQAATAFRLFGRGHTLAEVVVAMRLPPERVRALYHEWVTSLETGEWGR